MPTAAASAAEVASLEAIYSVDAKGAVVVETVETKNAKGEVVERQRKYRLASGRMLSLAVK
jgi:hypothetical protein